jgi:hypothetical protein
MKQNTQGGQKVGGTKIEFSDIVRKDVQGKYVNQRDDERNLNTGEKQAQEFRLMIKRNDKPFW